LLYIFVAFYFQYDQAGNVSEGSPAEDCIDLDEYGDGEDCEYNGVEDCDEVVNEDLRDCAESYVEDSQVNDVKLEADSKEVLYTGNCCFKCISLWCVEYWFIHWFFAAYVVWIIGIQDPMNSSNNVNEISNVVN